MIINKVISFKNGFTLTASIKATMYSELNQVFHYFIFDLLVYMFVI